MRNKWILIFLLCAQPYAIFKPLQAMNQDYNHPIRLPDLIQKKITEKMADTSTTSKGSRIFDIFKPKPQPPKPGFIDMLKRGCTEIFNGAWWGGEKIVNFFTSTASGVRWFYFDKPETWEGFGKKKALATAIIVGSLYYIRKHYYVLEAIDKKIDRSNKNSPKQDFIFGSWHHAVDEYKTSYQITQNQKKVARELLKQANIQSSGIVVRNNNAIIQPTPQNKITVNHLCTALAEEKQVLENDLRTISYLTDASRSIAEVMKENYDGSVELDAWNYHESAIADSVINCFKTKESLDLKEFNKNFLEKCNPYHIKRLLFIPPSWWRFFYIHHWRLGFWYTKATELYWKVYTTYLRTCALHDAMLQYQEDKKKQANSIIYNVGNSGSSNNVLRDM